MQHINRNNLFIFRNFIGYKYWFSLFLYSESVTYVWIYCSKWWKHLFNLVEDYTAVGKCLIIISISSLISAHEDLGLPWWQSDCMESSTGGKWDNFNVFSFSDSKMVDILLGLMIGIYNFMVCSYLVLTYVYITLSNFPLIVLRRFHTILFSVV